MAPMEGITGHIFRNALRDYFGDGIDRYYSPFLVPHEKKAMSSKERNEIKPENNEGIELVPQILTNNAVDFLRLEKAVHELGYKEVNLNLGCPSRTVAGKGRGSGFLGRIEELDDFLYEIFSGCIGDISVKTRIGEHTKDEFSQILEMFNKYNIKELTIHPRVRFEYYNGEPHRDVFLYAVKNSTNSLCYNGNIFCKEDVGKLISDIEEADLENESGNCAGVESIMIGRGMLANPALIREIKGGGKLEDKELKEFLKRLRSDYTELFSGETPVLQKMKELWTYIIWNRPGDDALIKKLLKCRTLSEYKLLEMQILKV